VWNDEGRRITRVEERGEFAISAQLLHQHFNGSGQARRGFVSVTTRRR